MSSSQYVNLNVESPSNPSGLFKTMWGTKMQYALYLIWCERKHPPSNDKFLTIKPYYASPCNCSIDGSTFEGGDEKTHMFGIEASMEESSWALVTSELSLFSKAIYPFIYVCKSTNLVFDPQGLIFECKFSCQTNF